MSRRTTTARPSLNKSLHIATVYWLMDETTHDNGLPKARFKGTPLFPPEDISIAVEKGGQNIDAEFPVTRSRRNQTQFLSSTVRYELIVSLDNFISEIASDPEGEYTLSCTPPQNGLSDQAAGPASGVSSLNVTGNCGESNAFHAHYRPFKIKFQVSKSEEDGHEILQIEDIVKLGEVAPHRGPHFQAIIDPRQPTGLRQKILVDWKPDWARRVNPSAASDFGSRGTQNVGGTQVNTVPSGIVIHNISGKAHSGFQYPLGGASVANFLRSNVGNGIHYLVDVDGHVTKLTHEDFQVKHGGAKAVNRRSWGHLPSINKHAIGIEHALFKSDDDLVFYEALIAASVDTVRLIREEIPSVVPWNILGHSAFNIQKPGCPGRNFPWKKYEDETISRLSILGVTVEAPLALGANSGVDIEEELIYDGFFKDDTARKIKEGSSEQEAIKELQQDLQEIGFEIDFNSSERKGHFKANTKRAVLEFHRRFSNGLHETPPNQTSTNLEYINLESAKKIKMVLAELDRLKQQAFL